MYTKQEKLSINWLEHVDGCTVADAIAYLQTLNPEYILNCWIEGDTHGADLECGVYKVRPYTPLETWQAKQDMLLRNLDTYTKGMKYYKERKKFDQYLVSARRADEYIAKLVENDKQKPL